ncbi:unnamed protein product [Mytilus coruscus]|uniref:ZMYM2-like/QRICH1 C-terminal domain-containing protein n=1 Tax=Mytilus coruscus TaxID=42192 RepID=A0A6J8C8X8_MYTCO|nr:unnamed protein product [Mytilus coruscus]
MTLGLPVLNAKMKELASRGRGSITKQADPITKEDEEQIWNSGVFGCDNSVALQNTVFFYNCKLFGMRGYDEHRNLECEQFSIGCDGSESRFIHFTGRTSKTFSGGLNQLHVKSKDIKHFCPKTKEIPPYSVYHWNKSHQRRHHILTQSDLAGFKRDDFTSCGQIETVNQFIRETNRILQKHSHRFALDLQNSRRDRYIDYSHHPYRTVSTSRYTYRFGALYRDGIHPCRVLARYWLLRICKFIAKDCA